MKYLSVDNFNKWIEYYVDGLATPAPIETTTKASASSINFSILLMSSALLISILKF